MSNIDKQIYEIKPNGDKILNKTNLINIIKFEHDKLLEIMIDAQIFMDECYRNDNDVDSIYYRHCKDFRDWLTKIYIAKESKISKISNISNLSN
jgi:hypothetical protein